MISDDTIEWLRSFTDPADRARALIGSGLAGHPDPRIQELERYAGGFGDEHREVLRVLTRQPKRTLEVWNQQQRAARIYGPRPPLPKFGATLPDDGWEPKPETVEGNQGQASSSSASVAGQAIAASHRDTDDGRADGVKRGDERELKISRELFLRLELAVNTAASGALPGAVGRVPTTPVAIDPNNPFTRGPKLRSSVLTLKDATKIYDGMAFAMWRHGAIMNVHVTIVWSAANVQPSAATVILGRYLNEAQKWARRGRPWHERLRRRAEMREGDELFWVYVHENGHARGFHTHVMVSLPVKNIKPFEAWSHQCLRRLCRRERLPGNVFRLRRSYATSEAEAVRAGWRWYRYLMKQTDPGAKIRPPKSLVEFSARQILKPYRFRTSLPVQCAQLVGLSQNISKGAQRQYPFINRLKRGELHAIYDGKELAEGRVWREQDPEYLAALINAWCERP